MFFIFIMAVSLSIDALGIGISYNIKGIRIPRYTKLIIGFVSAIIMQGALSIGSYFYSIMPTQVMKLVGVCILILIGVEFIRNSLFGGGDTTYDFDQSRAIDPLEGVFLSIALSADSISAGIAAASTGLTSMWVSILVGVMQVVFLEIAELLVKKSSFTKRIDSKLCGIFSGTLLIVIGFLRWFC